MVFDLIPIFRDVHVIFQDYMMYMPERLVGFLQIIITYHLLLLRLIPYLRTTVLWVKNYQAWH